MERLFTNFKEIETDRLLIRELRDIDYIDLYEIFSNEDVVRFQQIPPMPSKEVAKQAVSNFIKGYQQKQKIRRSIIYKDKMIGIVSIHSFNYDEKSVELGFMLNKDNWGLGIMTEAASSVIDYILKETDANIIIAKPRPENIGSIKVCEKIGLKRIGHQEKAIFNFVTEEYDDQLIYQLERNN